jgi:hypothetical protein
VVVAPNPTGATEEYDGTSWTNNPTGLNTARNSLGGAGTQTAALAFGGSIPPPSSATEEYDGSTWTTSPGSLNTARYDLAGCGTQTAALGFGGLILGPPVIISSATEEYNGSSWTSSNPLNTARFVLAGAGIQTAALAFGGTTGSATGATEEYNGATWTSKSWTGLNTARGCFRRLWHTNSCISIWRRTTCIQEQLKNIMVLIGQHLLQV